MNLHKAQMALDEDPEYGLWYLPTGTFLGWYGKAVIYSLWRSPASQLCPIGILDICSLEDAQREGRPIKRRLDLVIPPGPIEFFARLRETR